MDQWFKVFVTNWLSITKQVIGADVIQIQCVRTVK